MRIVSNLPSDRLQTGSLTATNDAGVVILGPVPARGKADGQIAAAHANPDRDPERIDGDHPTGTYRVVRVEHDKSPTHSYGPRFLLLDPIDGDALIAKKNGRAGLAIHGGGFSPRGAPRAPEGGLLVGKGTAPAGGGLGRP